MPVLLSNDLETRVQAVRALATEGLSQSQIAAQMGLSTRTVRTYLQGQWFQRPCVTCGTLVSVANMRAPRRCGACDPQGLSARRTRLKRRQEETARRRQERLDALLAQARPAEPSCQTYGRPNNMGYSLFRVGRQTLAAHRVVWEHLRGPIPAGYQVVHRCRKRGCINLAHLRLAPTSARVDIDPAQRARLEQEVLHEKAARLKACAKRQGACRIVAPTLWSNRRPLKVGDRQITPARVIWEATFGPVPEGARVWRTCRQPGCIAPAHLYLRR